MALFCHFLLFLFFLTIAKSDDPMGEYCNTNIANTTSTRVSKNINDLLPQLVKGTILSGFVATSNGNGKDKVYGLAQCRADVSTEVCSNCIKDASKQILKLCPNKAEATIWYDYCFLRYSMQNFVGKVDTSFGIFYYNVEAVNATDSKIFNNKLGSLMDYITSQAVIRENRGNGKGKTKLSNFETLYALVQCTRDLSPLSCSQCLAIAIGTFPKYCNDKKGCRVLYSSCYVRYELYPFYYPLGSGEELGNPSKTSYKSVLSLP